MLPRKILYHGSKRAWFQLLVAKTKSGSYQEITSLFSCRNANFGLELERTYIFKSEQKFLGDNLMDYEQLCENNKFNSLSHMTQTLRSKNLTKWLGICAEPRWTSVCVYWISYLSVQKHTWQDSWPFDWTLNLI